MTLSEFLEWTVQSGGLYAVKRLSGNDTTLTKSHQAGVYFPKWFFESGFPEINTTTRYNPRISLASVKFEQYDYTASNVNAVYYNSKYFPEKGLSKKYDEYRLTSWGGRTGGCPYQCPENTGALTVFVLFRTDQGIEGNAWICESQLEEDLVESWVGFDVLPGETFGAGKMEKRETSKSLITKAKRLVPKEWLNEFPSGADIFNLVAEIIPARPDWSADQLLTERRKFEFHIFRTIEENHVLPRLKEGFTNVDEFISYSHSVANRRKSRTGRSLELNLATIFTESSICFEEQIITEHNKRPDFLFPSGDDYFNPKFNPARLHMLAAKTCCKDRWRQILSEADRIPVKHLFTLQEGISSAQLQEMKSGNIRLIVPAMNFKHFPEDAREDLLDLEMFLSFIGNEQKMVSENGCVQGWENLPIQSKGVE